VHLQHETFLYGGPSAMPGLFPALASLRRAGRRAVVTMHHVVDPADVDREFTHSHRVKVPPPVARAGLSVVQRAIGRLADEVIVHEPRFGQVVPEAHVVPHGVETVVPADRGAAQERLGVDDGRLVVLCFGFLAPYKGLEAALEASALAGDEVHLVIAGGEHPRLVAAGDDYGARLRELAPPGTTFTGYVRDEDIPEWFAAADVALLPYPRPFATSGPLAIALAHETPVLLSSALARSAGAPDLLAVEPEPHAIGEQLRALAEQPGALSDLRVVSATLAAGRSWPEVARRHLALYAGEDG
jgi:glycosyltransferase involved in cell wall biosynthesis